MSIPAILISAIVGTSISMVWYSPRFFGKTLPKKNKGVHILIFLNTLLLAIVLGQFIRAFNTDPNIVEGMLIGALAGLGLITPVLATRFLLEKKSMSQLVTTALHYGLVTTLMGGIVALFS